MASISVMAFLRTLTTSSKDLTSRFKSSLTFDAKDFILEAADFSFVTCHVHELGMCGYNVGHVTNTTYCLYVTLMYYQILIQKSLAF